MFIHTQTATEKKKLYTVPYILCILIFAGNELKVYDIKQNITHIFWWMQLGSSVVKTVKIW